MYRDVDVYRGWERSICCSLVIPEKNRTKNRMVYIKMDITPQKAQMRREVL